MIAPRYKVNRIIQIDVTNRCDLSCSNCTRNLKYHPERYDMSPETFRLACRVLNKALPMFVKGIFGGNPCIHPQFNLLCEIMREEIPDQSKRGLWTNHLRGNGEVVRATFYPDGYCNFNAHAVAGAVVEFDRWMPNKIIPESRSRKAWHSSVLVAIKDFVGTSELPDEAAMWDRINNCDIDRDWSPCVIEINGQPYLYSCEVQAGFDLMYAENNGVLLTEESVNAGIETFKHQYERWCPNCGVAMKLKGHEDMDYTDDISISHQQMVQLRAPYRKTVLHASLDVDRCTVATDYERRVS